MHRYTNGDLIGEYIHYHYSNYERYGLVIKSRRAPGENEKLELTGVLDDQRKKVYDLLNAQYNKAYYDKLEAQLNYVTTNGKSPGEHMDIEQIQERILIEKIKAIHNVQFADGDIDWNTMSLTAQGKRKLLNAKVDSEKLKSFLIQGGMSKERAASFILSVNSLLNSRMGRSKDASSFSISNVLRHIKNIEGLIQNVTNAATAQRLQDRLNMVRDELVKLDPQDLNAFNEKRFDGERNIREELKAIAKLTMVGATVTMIEGDLAEALVLVTAETMGGVASAGIEDIMTDFLGPLRSENVYRGSAFSSKVKTGQLFKANHFEQHGSDTDNNLHWTVKSFKGTQGKTDVSITFTTNGKQQVSNASVKNYDLSNPNEKMQRKGLSLVSGTNMIYLLQHNARFLNHYLNQTAAPNDSDRAPSGVVFNANKMMQEMLLLLAFSGGGDKANINLSRKHAGIFIINDKSKGPGGFKIVSVVDLYKQLLKMKDSFNITLPNDQTWSNIWVDDESGGKEQRITNLLAEVMKHKISVSVKFDKMQSALKSI